ncbi:MAG: NAD-dependent epimerase/dehydratase family protein [Acidimicrobiaceae bacterium]|nr:NAD-dependent epimerase/dehydratase family protein [Acidimicrobiaceae bacterium]
MRAIRLTTNDVISWVIGRGGLLGRSVEQALRARGPVWGPSRAFSWSDPERLAAELAEWIEEFATVVGRQPWQIAWCAGAGVVGSGPSVLEQETEALSQFLAAASASLVPKNSSGAFFLASSAGGVYAGAGTPPFDERSPVAPLAPYGWNKLKQESLAARWSGETSIPLLIGRISNLYGPGQDLSKGQGLITQVCLRILARQPLQLYVPLDTIRDYLFADDAGRLVADGLTRLRREASESSAIPVVVKILASQQPVTVATVLAHFKLITKRPVSVIVGASPNARRQARDLRMLSSVWPELDRHPATSLSEGMRAVFTAILELAGAGGIDVDMLRGR